MPRQPILHLIFIVIFFLIPAVIGRGMMITMKIKGEIGGISRRPVPLTRPHARP